MITIKEIHRYINKEYPDVEELRIILFDGKEWQYYEYEFNMLSLEGIYTDFKDAGIGEEEDWKSELDKKLSKILKVSKIYVMDV